LYIIGLGISSIQVDQVLYTMTVTIHASSIAQNCKCSTSSST